MTSRARGGALSIRGLSKTLGGADRRFRIEVDALDLADGEVALLTGASGSGKSTLLELVGLASRPDSVTRFRIGGEKAGVDVAMLMARGDRAALAEIRARNLGFVVQTGGLLPFLTVAENVALAQDLGGRADRRAGAALLEALGLEGLAGALPATLSVGQRQRAAVARAVAHRPALLLADEPTASLDPVNKAQTASLILDVAARFGAAVLVATHEYGVFAAGSVRRLMIEAEAGPVGVEARLLEAA